MDTIWILGDQLNRQISSLADQTPGQARVLLIESEALLKGRRWHRQRLHLYLAAMRRFGRELSRAGFEVDHRRSPSLRAGLEAHRAEFSPKAVRAMAPSSWRGRERLTHWGVDLSPNDRFLCPENEFRSWAGDKKSLRMENFYRWQRKRLGILMDGDEPAGGRWNFDDENREPLPKAGPAATPRPHWPKPIESALDELDQAVLEDLDAMGAAGSGEGPTGLWPTSRRAALARLRAFIDQGLPRFGPHQDAMTQDSWHLAHSLLSPALNLGLLHPREVVDAAERAYLEGNAPIASVEGFIRQVIGWREFVWGLYWLWMPEYREQNVLGARRKLLPCLKDPRKTDMACVQSAVTNVQAHGYAHHIERLMVLANLATLAEIRPQSFLDWMERVFVDAAEWVMVPNVIGMGLHADGGRMASKPYVSGGAYLSRMSDHCSGCRYDPKRRTGEGACPFTALYWRFIHRNEERLARNPRTSMPVRSLAKLKDRVETLETADRILDGLSRGRI